MAQGQLTLLTLAGSAPPVPPGSERRASGGALICDLIYRSRSTKPQPTTNQSRCHSVHHRPCHSFSTFVSPYCLLPSSLFSSFLSSFLSSRFKKAKKPSIEGLAFPSSRKAKKCRKSRHRHRCHRQGRQSLLSAYPNLTLYQRSCRSFGEVLLLVPIFCRVPVLTRSPSSPSGEAGTGVLFSTPIVIITDLVRRLSSVLRGTGILWLVLFIS